MESNCIAVYYAHLIRCNRDRRSGTTAAYVVCRLSSLLVTQVFFKHLLFLAFFALSVARVVYPSHRVVFFYQLLFALAQKPFICVFRKTQLAQVIFVVGKQFCQCGCCVRVAGIAVELRLYGPR